MQFTVRAKNVNGWVKVPRLNKDHASTVYRTEIAWKMAMKKLFKAEAGSRETWDRINGGYVYLASPAACVEVTHVGYISELRITI